MAIIDRSWVFRSNSSSIHVFLVGQDEAIRSQISHWLTTYRRTRYLLSSDHDLPTESELRSSGQGNNRAILVHSLDMLSHSGLRLSSLRSISILLLSQIELVSVIGISSADLEIEKDSSPEHIGIDVSDYDIIRLICDDESVADVATSIDTTITAVLSTRQLFPHPGMIDRTNQIGYTQVSEEFFDQKRITTANFHRLSEKFFIESLRNYVHVSERCLELGPGRGWLRRNFSWPSVFYVAVDVSTNMLRSNAGSLITTSARLLPFPSGYFHSVFSSLGDPYCFPAALCEIHRILQDDGYLFFSAPSRKWSMGVRSKDERDITYFTLSDGTRARVYSFTFTDSELTDLMTLCGYEVDYCEAIKGAELPVDAIFSPTISQAASNLGISVRDMPIINVARLRKRKGSVSSHTMPQPFEIHF